MEERGRDSKCAGHRFSSLVLQSCSAPRGLTWKDGSTVPPTTALAPLAPQWAHTAWTELLQNSHQQHTLLSLLQPLPQSYSLLFSGSKWLLPHPVVWKNLRFELTPSAAPSWAFSLGAGSNLQAIRYWNGSFKFLFSFFFFSFPWRGEEGDTLYVQKCWCSVPVFLHSSSVRANPLDTAVVNSTYKWISVMRGFGFVFRFLWLGLSAWSIFVLLSRALL